MSNIKYLITEEGKKILFSKWRYLSDFKCYLSDNISTYNAPSNDIGYYKTVNCNIYSFMNNVYLVFELNEDDFRSSNNSIFIGATDVTTGTVFQTLIFIDKNNSFIKIGAMSISYILNSFVKPGKNILNLGDTLKFNFDRVKINKEIPEGIQSINTLKNLFSYETTFYIADNPIDF